MAELAIGEVARRSGLAPSALRYYERAGLIRPSGRRGGRRVFDEDVLLRLRIVELAKRAGFTIAEIRRLLGGFRRRTPPGARWRALATAKREELAVRIEEAQQMQRLLDTVTRCTCPSFDDCARALEEP